MSQRKKSIVSATTTSPTTNTHNITVRNLSDESTGSRESDDRDEHSSDNNNVSQPKFQRKTKSYSFDTDISELELNLAGNKDKDLKDKTNKRRRTNQTKRHKGPTQKSTTAAVTKTNKAKKKNIPTAAVVQHISQQQPDPVVMETSSSSEYEQNDDESLEVIWPSIVQAGSRLSNERTWAMATSSTSSSGGGGRNSSNATNRISNTQYRYDPFLVGGGSTADSQQRYRNDSDFRKRKHRSSRDNQNGEDEDSLEVSHIDQYYHHQQQPSTHQKQTQQPYTHRTNQKSSPTSSTQRSTSNRSSIAALKEHMHTFSTGIQHQQQKLSISAGVVANTDNNTPNESIAIEDTSDFNLTSHSSSSGSDFTEGTYRLLVDAIYEIGISHASPAVIMEHMIFPTNSSLYESSMGIDESGRSGDTSNYINRVASQVTSERVKSHLQKYRKNKKKSKDEFLREYDRWTQRAQTVVGSISAAARTNLVTTPTAVIDMINSQPDDETRLSSSSSSCHGKNSKYLMGGDLPAYLTFSIMLEDEQKKILREGGSGLPGMLQRRTSASTEESVTNDGMVNSVSDIQPISSTIATHQSNSLPSAKEYAQSLSGARILLPILSEEERQSSLGVSISHVVGLFYSMSHALIKERKKNKQKTDKNNMDTSYRQVKDSRSIGPSVGSISSNATSTTSTIKVVPPITQPASYKKHRSTRESYGNSNPTTNTNSDMRHHHQQQHPMPLSHYDDISEDSTAQPINPYFHPNQQYVPYATHDQYSERQHHTHHQNSHLPTQPHHHHHHRHHHDTTSSRRFSGP